jgi:hypothetical protein
MSGRTGDRRWEVPLWHGVSGVDKGGSRWLLCKRNLAPFSLVTSAGR